VPVLTWRLVVGAAVGSLVVLLLPAPPPLGLWVVNGVLLVAAVADWLLAVRPADLEVERELPGIVPLGTEPGSPGASPTDPAGTRCWPGAGSGCGWRMSWRRRWGR
jgi:hypothetical protein